MLTIVVDTTGALLVVIIVVEVAAGVSAAVLVVGRTRHKHSSFDLLVQYSLEPVLYYVAVAVAEEVK